MRSDVKVGVVIGLAVLGVLGWYFLRDDKVNSIRLTKPDKKSLQLADRTANDRPLPPSLWNVPPPSKGSANAGATASGKPASPRTAGGKLSVEPTGAPSPIIAPIVRPVPPTKTEPHNPPVRVADSSASPSKPNLSSPPMVAAANDGRSTDSEKAADEKPPIVAPPKNGSGSRSTSQPPLILPPSVFSETAKKPEADVLPNKAVKISESEKPAERTSMTGDEAKVSKPPTTLPKLTIDLPKPREATASKTPEEAKERTHIVKKYDTLAILAEQYYGSQRFVDVIVKANPQVDPRRLKLGTKLLIPPLSPATSKAPAGTAVDKTKTEAAAADVKPANAKPAETAKTPEGKTGEPTYTVKANDSFYSIARSVLGSGDRWRELQQLNKDLCPDPSDLRPGMKLRLPSSKTETTPAAEEKTKARSRKAKAGGGDKPAENGIR